MHELIKPTRIDTFWSVSFPLITYTVIGLVGGLFTGGFFHLLFVFRQVQVPGELFFGIGIVVLWIGIAVGVSEGMQEYQAIKRDAAHYNLLESYLGSDPEVIRSSKDGPSFVFVQQPADRSRQRRCTTTDLQDPEMAYHVHLCAMSPASGLITESYAVLRLRDNVKTRLVAAITAKPKRRRTNAAQALVASLDQRLQQSSDVLAQAACESGR